MDIECFLIPCDIVGIDPERSTVFIQSHIPAHAELTWLLNCITPVNWLDSMIQYKEKAIKQGENVSMGLYDYPVLMAADILLYQTDFVPVGDDQRQHIELARDVCRRFHDLFCSHQSHVFQEPAALIGATGSRIMSLQDGTSKMSKSAHNDMSRINLLDPPDVIHKKIKRCKTDALRHLDGSDIDRPECGNLLRMYGAVNGWTPEQVQQDVNGISWSQFKPRLAEAVISHLEPIQWKYKDIMADEGVIVDMLRRGQDKASEVAEQTLLQAKESMGFYRI